MKRLAAFAAALALAAPAALHARSAVPDPRSETEHTVAAGETLGGIASRAGVARVLIIEANALQPPYAVKAGQKLIIPRRRTHTVKPGDTTFSIAMDYGVPWTQIAAANGLDPKAAIRKGQTLNIPTLIAVKPSAKTATKGDDKGAAKGETPRSAKPAPAKVAASSAAASSAPATTAKLPPDTPAPRMIWPLRGEVRRAFSPRGGAKNYHDGIDIAAARGDPVRAAAQGRVIFAGLGPKEYGQTVIIYHAGRWTTTYSFLDKVSVKDGDQVRKGQQIGLAGQSGLAPAPQLHFEVRRNRVAQDPADYLPRLPGSAPASGSAPN